MLNIERDKTYEIRLLPNINKPSYSVVSFSMLLNGRKLISYFSYYLNDNKADVFRFGHDVRYFIDHVFNGYYGTSEGYFISEYECDCYYANEDKSNISTNVESELKKYTDVVYYERMHLCDVKCSYILTFKTRTTHGYCDIYNIGLKKDKPLWNVGEDQNNILDLYKNGANIDTVIEQYRCHVNNIVLNKTRIKKLKSII